MSLWDEHLKPSLLDFFFLATFCLVPAFASMSWAQQDNVIALQRAFEHPPEESRIMMRWWWFGPSVTKAELEREMQLMKEGGIGGFEVQTVYPLALDDPASGFRNFPFLSDEFIEALRFTSLKARELGLRMDLTLGSGWPYGGPSVPVTEAAGKLRVEVIPVPARARRVPLPEIATGERFIAAFLAPGDTKNFTARDAREVSDIGDRVFHLAGDLRGPRVLLVFIASRTGMTVKRAAVGAEGFVLDHYSRGAIEHYLNTVGERLIDAFGSSPPRAVFCDSLEVYGSDWTSDFLEEFRRRRGYDLKPYLPALAGDIGEMTSAIRHDWGRTLTELFDERFLVPLEEWARRHGTLLRAQVYGIPPASLSSNRLADLAEGESSHWKGFTPTRWASSANHLYGRPITSSEVWTWLHSPAFRATPLDMKAEADLHFLQGINQLIGHGWPQSPESAGKPGWRFYAAAAFNENNPWWLVMPDVAAYFQRVSFMLRQGRPWNDVALYLPTDDAWAGFSPGKVSIDEAMDGLIGPTLIPQILASGYGFDFIDDEAIEQVGISQPVLILPGVERISTSTYRKIEAFAERGGIVIATRRTPTLAPGLLEAETQASQVRELSRKLFEAAASRGIYVADENFLGTRLNAVFPPDLSTTPQTPDLGFIHRRLGESEIYFLANTSNEAIRTRAQFGTSGLQPEWWDPFTGRVRPADAQREGDRAISVAVDFEPYESRILVFTKRNVPQHSKFAAPPRIPAAIDLSSGWKVTFEGLGRTIALEALRSWTEDEVTRFFSGVAVYEKTAIVPESALRPGVAVYLDLGQGTPITETHPNHPGMQAWLESPVREAAVVYVNGRRAGSIWHPPYALDVAAMLRHGENALRIVVGNLAINELAGQAPADYRLLNSRYGVRFTPQDMENLQPLPSGLLGGVRLIPRKAQAELPAH